MAARPVPVVLAAGLLAGAAVAGAPQQTTPPQAQQPTFRGGTRTVMVPVSVTDEYGDDVRDLKQKDFEIRDNGTVQPITFFDHEIQPVTALLLIDGSASMLLMLDKTIAAADEFVLRMLPGDRLRIGSFAEDWRLSPAFTGDRDALLDYLTNQFNVRIGRRTRLWDAMDEAITVLTPIAGRRVLIVLSDGLDTWSFASFDDVRQHASRADVAIFFLRIRPADMTGQQMEVRPGPDGSSPGHLKLMPADGFERLARETGGELIETAEQDGMTAPFTQVALDLHSQYLLGFTPAVLDNKVHDLTVRVSLPRAKVRARRSYLAAPDTVKKL
jgi:Ca-activated chloride channel homolog